MITKRTLTVKCRDSLLGTVAWLRARGSGFDSWQGKDPLSLPFDVYRRTFPVTKRPGTKVSRFPPSSSKVQHKWCCTSTAPIRLAAVDTEIYLYLNPSIDIIIWVLDCDKCGKIATWKFYYRATVLLATLEATMSAHRFKRSLFFLKSKV